MTKQITVRTVRTEITYWDYTISVPDDFPDKTAGLDDLTDEQANLVYEQIEAPLSAYEIEDLKAIEDEQIVWTHP